MEPDGPAAETFPLQHVVLGVHQAVAVHEAGDQHCGFVQRELAADTRSLTGTERLEQCGGAFGGHVGCEPVRVEQLDIVAPLRLAV